MENTPVGNLPFTFSEEEKKLSKFLDNHYVQTIHGDRIFYHNEFYVAMYKLITEQKMTYVEAYEKLGFPVAELGENRAYQAGKNAMQKAKEDKLFTCKPANYDGRVPLSQMPKLSFEEEHAYLISRTIYLEMINEYQKKILLS